MHGRRMTKELKWVARIEDVLRKKVLHSGWAGKLAGQLAWASQVLFRRLGRAMLRPLLRAAAQ